MNKIILTNADFFSEFLNSSEFGGVFENSGLELVYREQLDGSFDFEAAAVFGLVITPPQKVDKEFLTKFPHVQFISPFGVGVDHIDLQAAKNRGIIVTNVPKVHAAAAAEMITAYIFALAKNLTRFRDAMCRQIWDRQTSLTIAGKTLGIIGMGNVGQRLAELAQSLGLIVIGHDLVNDDEFLKRRHIEPRSLAELLRASDFVSVNVPLTAENRHLINKDSLQLMKRGSFLINTSRGGVVDETALLEALEKNHLAGAALDVFSEEPPFKNKVLQKLINHPKVITTPHIATNTFETKTAIAKKICEDLLKVVNGDISNINEVV